MDKNSLILEIKNDLNSIKKQVEVALAKLAVLESMIELDKKLGISVQTSGEPSLLELSRRVDDRQGIVQPEITSRASNEELGVVTKSESRDNACIVRELDVEEVAEPVKQPEPVVETETSPIIESESVIEDDSEQEIVEIEQVIELEIEDKVEEKERIIEEVEEESTPNSNVELRNLMSVIGLNDRFRFRHDLFSNSDEIFRETIDILNKIENFDKAVDYLMKKFAWDEEDATVVYFYDIIKPKF